MNSEDFKNLALRTEKVPEQLNFSLGGIAMLLNLATQTANLIDLAKKTIIYDKPFDEAAFREQLGKVASQVRILEERAHGVATPEQAAHLHTPNIRVLHGVIGMFGEAGELTEAVLKGMQTGNLDLVNIGEETGDSDWYKAIIHDETGVSETQSREKVIAKLKKRYGEKYSNEAALNRDLNAERQALETTAA